MAQGTAGLILAYAAEAILPFVAVLLVPSRYRRLTLVGLGAIAFSAVCAIAYHDNLVQNGGDSSGGWELVGFVVGLNSLHFAPLWLLGSFAGLLVRRRLDGHQRGNFTSSP